MQRYCMSCPELARKAGMGQAFLAMELSGLSQQEAKAEIERKLSMSIEDLRKEARAKGYII